MNLAPALSHEAACARVAALYQPRWLRHYVSGKLRRDHVFAAAYELLHDSDEPILDVGCGVGLLPFYLRERGLTQPVTGIDTDARKLQHARGVAQGRYHNVTFLEQDAGAALPSVCGNVTLFDVLHYLAPQAQETLLRGVTARVSPRGLALVRDCPRDRSARFWTTYLAERFAQAISWNIGVPLHFATREEITAAFTSAEFSIEERPMWGGGPFNNRLFTFRRRSPATVPAAG